MTSNGKSHSVHLGQLPLPLSGRSLEVVYFGNEPADQQDGPGTSCQPHQDNEGDGNPMKEDGQSEEDRDDALDGQCPVLPNRAIFISGDDAPTVGCEYAISIFETSKSPALPTKPSDFIIGKGLPPNAFFVQNEMVLWASNMLLLEILGST